MPLREEQNMQNPGRNSIDLGVRRPGQKCTNSVPTKSTNKIFFPYIQVREMYQLLERRPGSGRGSENRKQSMTKALTYKML